MQGAELHAFGVEQVDVIYVGFDEPSPTETAPLNLIERRTFLKTSALAASSAAAVARV